MNSEKELINKLLIRAEILSTTDKLFEQIEIYKEVLKLDSNNIEALINISDCLLKMNLNEDAKRYAFKAYLLNNGNDDMATVNYSCVLINAKNYLEATKILEIEKTNNSENYLIYNNLGFTYFLTTQYANALENYNISIIIEEKNPLAYCNRGVLKYFIFNDDEGITDLEKAHLYGDIEATMILQNIFKDKTKLS